MRKITKIAKIVVVALLMGLSTAGQTNASVQDFYFKDFTADYYLTKAEDGTSRLHVKEVLTADFPKTNQNHGITRYIPFTNQGGANRTVQDTRALNLSVTRNGKPEQISKIDTTNDAYVAYIGNASEYVHGEQIYTLEYDFANVITEFDQAGKNISGEKGAVAYQELYWDTNGTGWLQRFDRVTARLHLPSDILANMHEQAWCYVGKYGSKGDGRCEMKRTEDGYSFTAEDLGVGENLTYDVEFNPGTFVVMINKNYTLVIFLAVEVLLLGGLVALAVRRWCKEARPQYKLYKSTFVKPEYQAPRGINVAEGGIISIARTGKTYVATLLELAVNKQVKIKKAPDEAKHEWSIILDTDPNNLTVPQQEMLNILSGDGKFIEGEEIPIIKHRATHYLAGRPKAYQDGARKTLIDDGYLVNKLNTGRMASGFMTVALITILIMMIVTRLDQMSFLQLGSSGAVVGQKILPSIMAVVVFGGMLVLGAISYTAKFAERTKKGIQLARYLDGLKLYINMAEEERLKFLQSVKGADTSTAGIVKLYEKLLPWASLFGLEQSWAKELAKYYEVAGLTDEYEVSMLDAVIAGSIVHDVNHIVTTSTTYSSGSGSSSFSSGGGGGGFSGGGGGGGGGGGW